MVGDGGEWRSDGIEVRVEVEVEVELSLEMR
jgi:hypothetical protein